MIDHSEWLRTRKKLLEQVKRQVEARTGPPPMALRRYALTAEREFRAGWTNSSMSQLTTAIQQAKVVLGGDFHAYSQSQRAHVRILRDLVEQNEVVLALECLGAKHDEVTSDFLRGRISEDRFLKAVEWQKNWSFPWEHYRPLFELARDRGFEVRGISDWKVKALPAVDQSVAQRLSALRAQSPHALVYTIIGEWHLASAHLPKRLRSIWRDPQEVVVLFQDVESLYFRLAGRRRQVNVDVLKARENRFCLMGSPPWVKWQSYLMYLEHAYDRDLQDDVAIDYTDHIVSLIELLEVDLKIHIKTAKVQVYGPGSHAPLARLKNSLPARWAKTLIYHLQHDQSFYLPEKDWLYLSRSTINHASQLAGQFIHGHLSQRRRTLWDMPGDFLPMVWVEAVGFFFSKWINPKRKAETLESLRLQLSARRPRDRGRQALMLAMDHRLTEVVWVQTGRMRKMRFRPRDRAAYLEAARILGSMLGERLFQKVRSKTISLPELMNYLRIEVGDGEFSKFYWKLVKQLESDQAI